MVRMLRLGSENGLYNLDECKSTQYYSVFTGMVVQYLTTHLNIVADYKKPPAPNIAQIITRRHLLSDFQRPWLEDSWVQTIRSDKRKVILKSNSHCNPFKVCWEFHFFYSCSKNVVSQRLCSRRKKLCNAFCFMLPTFTIIKRICQETLKLGPSQGVAVWQTCHQQKRQAELVRTGGAAYCIQLPTGIFKHRSKANFASSCMQ